MGKFDGFLILSDLDGTFVGQDTVRENMKAIKHFTDLGGKFGFATGRSMNFLRDKEYFSIVNAPCCLLNGGVVYDFKAEQLLYERHLEFTSAEFLNAIADRTEYIKKISIHTDASDKDEVFTDFAELSNESLTKKPVKIICVFESPSQALEFKSTVMGMELFKDTYICRSWGVGVEFNAANGTKGHAMSFIKAYLGNVHTSIGVGDFENDLTLIRYADIGVAVGNAVDELKREADWTVRPCSELAIKDLVERLEKQL